MPRRALRTPPNASPITRRLGTSGKTEATYPDAPAGPSRARPNPGFAAASRQRARPSRPAARVTGELLLDDAPLVLRIGVPERRPDEEAVELRLGQRERALVLDRVLGRQHEERVVERTGLAVDGDLLLCHGLEQRRLRLRHGAVDLVDEYDVREHGPVAELEVALLLVEDREPRHVGGLEVGRA